MATLDELVQKIADVQAAVTPLAGAINTLEANLTAALANVGLSAADQAKIDAAMAALNQVATDVTAAVADASDGVDEAAGGTTPTEPT